MPKGETKGIIADIANQVLKLFDVDRFRTIINTFIAERYNKSTAEIEKEFNFNVGFGNQKRDLDMLNTYVFDNIKNLTEDMQDRLRQELQRGLLGNETPAQLRKRISNIFKGDNPTRFRYEDRIKMIARTEGKRAANMASYSAAQKLGKKSLRKYLSIRLDARTSDICLAENAKYGSKEQSIPLEKDFVVKVNGKEYRAQFPPMHPNCRTILIITQGNKES